MKTRTMVAAAVVATGILVTGAVAQHEEHHDDQAALTADNADVGGMGGMISSNTMTQMPRMMMGQNEIAKLVDQLMRSFAAVEIEIDPAALRTELAEHGALIKELQAKVQSQSHMMDMMQHMMGGSMMGGAATDLKDKK